MSTVRTTLSEAAGDIPAMIHDKVKPAIPSPQTTSSRSESPIDDPKPSDPTEKVPQGRKYGLLAIFSLALFIDIWCWSAFFIFTGPISEDLQVPFSEQSWVITSYAVTFAAFLLFWGRVSDLYSAKPVFSYGFILLGLINLVISFVPDKYSFFVLRAISGVAGACLVPAAFRLIVQVFEPEELSKAFTLYGLSGPLGNVTGSIIAGFIQYIPNGGQMSAWRWFFRILCIMILPVAVGSLYLIPNSKGSNADTESKWKRLDLLGAGSMLAAIVLLILGLTLGASYGWKKPGFLVPFLLSWALFGFFFYWETVLPEGYAILPTKTWRIPNFPILIIFALFVYGWWAVNNLAFAGIFMSVRGEKAIVAAVRLLPQGVAAALMAIVLTLYPVLSIKPRVPIVVGGVLGIVGYILFTRSGTQVGADYWRYLFPAFLIGSAGNFTMFNATSVGVMISVPPEMAGVAGAVLQVAFQIGSAVGLAVQSGLETINPGSISNFENVQASFYFEMGWEIVWVIAFLIFYRPKKTPTPDGAAEEGALAIVA
jgi:MFS family permease